MEEDGSNIVEMPIEGEQTTSTLVRPDLDLVIVAARNEQGLCSVKVDSSDGAVVFLEPVNERAHSVVPQLNGGRVEGNENPWSAKKRQRPLSRLFKGGNG